MNPMLIARRVAGILALTVLAFLIWVAWLFQPWMPAGRVVRISTQHLGDFDFEVWQTKTNIATEPFATTLFARKQGGQWNVFLLDFEDTFRPKIVLQKENGGVGVFRGSEKLGFFDERQLNFVRASDGTPFPPSPIDSQPPGKW